MSLRIEKLNVQLQQSEIIRDIDIEIKKGEFVSLLGPSGCGKTTLLKSIAGLLQCTSGDIILDENSIQHLPPEHRGAVIVFQDLRLFPHMTVEKNIAFPMDITRVPKVKQQEIIKTLLDEVQLSGYEKRKIREMSGGQRQRVALARALAATPNILLLDEPFSGLDERLRLEMGVLVRKIQRERKITTILVTHDKREALQMSDRIALMKEGTILQYDTPQRIFYHPSSKEVADYFGKMNYVQGQVRDGQFVSTVLRIKSEHVPTCCGRYDAMIHPAAITVKPEKGDGIIREITFMGEAVELLVELKGIDLIATMDSRLLEAKEIEVGYEVAVQIDTDHICFFRTEEVTDETHNI